MKRPLAHLIATAALALVSVWPAGSARAVEDFTGAETLSLDQLDEVRGGLQIPGGMEIGFGAVMSTFVDGSLALRTRLTWTDAGPVEVVEAGQLTPNLAAAAAAGGITLAGGPTVEGVVVAGDGGITAVVHSITGVHIADMVFNTASNREIRQSTAITFNIPAFAQMQQDVAFQAMSLRLQDAVSAGLRNALVH